MSGQTIRDVLVKVSLVNGEMKLSPPDMSSWHDEIAKAKKEYQSYLQLGRGILHTSSALGVLPGELAHGAAATEGLYQSLTALSTINPPVAAGILATAGALLTWRQYVIEARRNTEAYYDMLIEKSQASQASVARSAAIQSAHSQRAIGIEEASASASHFGTHALASARLHERTEISARAMDERFELSPEHRSVHRQMLESQANFRDVSGAQANRLDELRGRHANIARALENESTQRTRIHNSAKASVNSIREQQANLVKSKFSSDNPLDNLKMGASLAEYHLTGNSARLQFQGGEVIAGRAGMSAEAKTKHKALDSDAQRVEVDAQDKIAKSAQETSRLKEQQLATEKEIQGVLTAQGKTVRDYQNQQYQVVQKLKQGEHNFALTVGGLTHGEANYQTMLQDEADKNSAIRKANVAAGREENHGITAWTAEQLGRVLPGSAAEIEKEKQEKELFKSRGLRSRVQDEGTLEGAESHLVKVNKLKGGEESKEGLSQSIENVKSFAAQLNSSQELATATAEMFSAMEEKYKASIAALTEYKRKIAGWTPAR